MIGRFSSVQSLSRIQLFETPWTAARQASLSITSSRSLPKLMSIELVMPSNHLILFIPFSSHLQSFPASGSFQMSQLFTSGGQSIGVSASVLPMNNIQKTKIMASGPITSWQIDGETVADFIFLGSKITADSDCSHEIKRRLLLGSKVMTNLDSILKAETLLCQQRSV